LLFHCPKYGNIYIGNFSAKSDGEKKGVNVLMTSYKAKYTGTLKAVVKFKKLRWLNYSDLDITSEVYKKIFSFLHKKGN
jgi:hypothetical protein